jgi:hypothetical protein
MGSEGKLGEGKSSSSIDCRGYVGFEGRVGGTGKGL